MRRRGEAGYTLAELLVACLILTLLAALAMPKIMDAINRSKQVRVTADLRNIQDALDRHYVDYGYFPVKLNDLVTRSYLRRGTTFRSPVSGYWYFYAVDENRTNHPPMAYILGAPTPQAGKENELYPGRPLPKGRNPTFYALQWLTYGGGKGLNIYATDEDGQRPMEPPPTTLEAYRLSCRDGAPGPCDLRTN